MTDSAICVIGDTPLARVLTAKLCLAGENAILMPPQDDKTFAEPLWIKDESAMQKKQITLSVTGIMPPQPKLVILALSPERLKAGLTLFSAAKANNCPVISFCRTDNPQFVSQILQRPIIQAYFNGWLNAKDNDTMLLTGSTAGIAVSISSRHTYFELLQKLLAKTYFKITFHPDDTRNFWDFFVPYTACALFSLQHRAKIRDIAKDAKLRVFINNILDEIIAAVPEEVPVEKEQIISSLYSTPANWTSPVATTVKSGHTGELMFIADTLKRNSAPNAYPICRKIITDNLRKILSSVEFGDSQLKK